MRQADVYEKAVRQLTSGMNLVDIKVYADEDGEVEAVLLKYMDPKYGKTREPEDRDPVPMSPEPERILTCSRDRIRRGSGNWTE